MVQIQQFMIQLTPSPYYGDDFYEGKVIDLEYSTVTLTRMKGNLYQGMILTDQSSWHLEIVRNQMVFYDARHYSTVYNTTCSQGQQQQMNINLNKLNTKKSGFLFKRQISNSYSICNMSLYAEQSFIQLMGANTQKQMQAGLQLASQIYEAVFNVKLIAVKSTLLNGNYGINSQTDISGFLNTAANELAQHKYSNDDPNQYCLTHIFTNKNFGSTLGLAFKGDGTGVQVGGICDGAVEGNQQALNVGVSTAFLGLDNSELKQIPWITTLTHEMGHNFGASHDEQTLCSTDPSPKVMAAVVNAEISQIPDFSVCSKNDITSNIATKKCFATANRFVGKDTNALRQQIAQNLTQSNSAALSAQPTPLPAHSAARDTAQISATSQSSPPSAKNSTSMDQPFILKNALGPASINIPSISFLVFYIQILC